MTREQTAALLALIAVCDRRSVGVPEIAAWHQLLGEVDYDDACEAVRRHFRGSRDYLMPVHVVDGAAEIDRERRRIARLDAGQRAQAIEAAAVRRDRTGDVGTALARLGDAATIPAGLPSRFEPDPDRDGRIADGVAAARAALPAESPSDGAHRRALARSRSEHGKPMRDRQPRRTPPGSPVTLPEPATPEVADLAKHYLRAGWPPGDVSDRLGVNRAWCDRQARRLAPMGPVGWCGLCTFDGRMRKPGSGEVAVPCPDCHPGERP